MIDLRHLGPGRRPARTDHVWLSASRAQLPALAAELRTARTDPPVLVRGRRLERDEPGAALADHCPSEHFDDLGSGARTARAATRDAILAALDAPDAWLLISDPDWIDEVSLDVVARVVTRTERGVVVLAATGPPTGPVAEAVLSRGHHLEASLVDDASLDVAVADFDDDAPALAAALRDRTAGRAHLAAAVVDDLRALTLAAPGPVLDAIRDIGPTTRDIVESATSRLGDEIRRAVETAAASGRRAPAALLDDLAAEGLVDDSGRVIPVVGDALLAQASAATRAVLVDELAASVPDEPDAVLATVEGLERLGAAPTDAPAMFLAAAGLVAPLDPDRAVTWLDGLATSVPALDRLPVLVRAGRIASALDVAARLPDDVPAAGRALARGVEALGLQRAARFDDAAGAYAGADPDNALGAELATLAGVPAGLIGRANGAPGAASASAAGRFVTGVGRLSTDLDEAIGALAAAETLGERLDVSLWPDTPTALGALVLTAAGRHDDAVRTLEAAPPGWRSSHQHRLRLIQAWVALRQGRWADSTSTAEELAEVPLALRERYLLASIRVALVHRGDVDELPGALDLALDVLRRHPVDLGSVLAHAEVALACAKTGRFAQSTSLIDQLLDLFDGAGPRSAMAQAVDLVDALSGVLAEDAVRVRAAAARLIDPDLARVVIGIADGTVPSDAAEVAWRLVESGAVLEGSLVAGQAALNATSKSEAAGPLKAAREIRARLPRRGADESVGVGALSDREVEIARLVVDGHTYKEIGAQLYISAKTVEHHVAHIRTKLGATSRAEMLTTLRAGLDA